MSDAYAAEPPAEANTPTVNEEEVSDLSVPLMFARRTYQGDAPSG